ncbi:MAG: DGQHR domain-containing protein [Xanthobacteraceae bacterium]
MAATVIKAPAIEVVQNGHKFYLCTLTAKQLTATATVSRREPEQDKGYQRLFVESHINAIRKFLESGKSIPVSLLVTFKKAKFSNRILRINRDPKNGWITDGQHRWLAARQLGDDISLPIIAFIDLPIGEQIDHFITINREARGVPSSLYLDLLKSLPKEKTAAERAKERTTDIARELAKDEESPFHGRIVVLTSPKKGELSLTNFVRKVEPIIRKGGVLAKFKVDTQVRILNNYFNGISDAYPDEADQYPPVFFQTIGFGAFMNFFPAFFTEVYPKDKAFTRERVRQKLVEMGDPKFDEWRKMGSGTQAENTAAEQLDSLLDGKSVSGKEPEIAL